MKFLSVLALTLLCTLATSVACECVEPPIEERIKRSHLIFTGVCLSVTEHKDTLQNEFVFQVESAWLNRPAQRVTVFSPSYRLCGYGFTPTKRYVVWTSMGTRSRSGQLWTALCFGNRPIESDRAKQELATLGAPLIRYPVRK
jgi:hypothetical protein